MSKRGGEGRRWSKGKGKNTRMLAVITKQQTKVSGDIQDNLQYFVALGDDSYG